MPCIRYDERQLYLLNNPEELKAGTTDLTLRWPDATVYYTMDSTIGWLLLLLRPFQRGYQEDYKISILFPFLSQMLHRKRRYLKDGR